MSSHVYKNTITASGDTTAGEIVSEQSTLQLTGTFGTATITLMASTDKGVTYQAVPDGAFTAGTVKELRLTPGTYVKFTTTNAGGTNVLAVILG